ncbi:BZ3500_MvSof-1268-A1-R1_Chr1-3g02133 [Microbotryum saponariae]|uniref:BZ3500_MvSof-1268-A1-R1_Chr1-3g02133 protein n=1 Tax=Microbotryum saponariae TaxID=289078 RepID=A0A2X0KUL7_9BASI|nr:BZ3500_MvSof-1268-A1-R1_Chr1-3g02133 [Microbotryum saponariae]SCZ95476.1 BZ3501_MvSof-1269-A2-R1_Chr1-3g01735 [Microbotryum saponariae]
MPSLPLEASAYADSIIALASALTERAHLFVDGSEDVELRAKCEDALKMGFDRALTSEASAFPHLSTLITSLAPSSAPSTRSRSRSSGVQEPERLEAETILPPTPLSELTTQGMEPEMIWEQLEMRNSVVDEVLQEMFGGEGREEEEGEEEDEDSDEDDLNGGIEGEDDFDMSAFDKYDRGEGSDEEEGDDDEEEEEDSDGEGSYEDDEEEEDDDAESQDTEDELAVERFVEMEPFEADIGKPTPGWPNTYIIRGGEENDVPEQAQEEDEDPEADETKELSLENFDRPGRKSKGPKRTGPASAVDDAFFSLHDFHQQVDEGEAEMDRMIRGEADSDDGDDQMDDFDLFAPVDSADKDEDDEDEDEEEEDLDVAGIMYSDFFDPPSRPLGGKKDGKKGGGSGPEDDKPKEKGKRKANEVKTSTITIVTNPIPTTNGDAAAGKGKDKGTDRVKFADKVKVKLIPSRGGRFAKLVEALGYDKAVIAFEQLKESERGMGMEENAEDDKDEEGSGDDGEMDEDEEGEEREEEEDEEDEEEEEEEEESQLEEQATMQRVSSSLFDDDEDDEVEGESKGEKLSRHERRLLQLSSQIASLEAENVGPKKWATLGEAQARNRPANSLLEEDLEFERMGKVVPVITEETTKSIEDLIKKRILDNQFDDVERRRAVDPHAFLPSRFMELQDTKSNKSLAEIYEDDYQSARAKETGEKVVHEIDAALEAKHQDIEELFDDLAAKLDALSNARFTPKPPKSTISTITNAPSLSLESALPPTQTATSMLAPEEVFVPDPTNEDRSDFTPAQKKAARQKRRKARAAMAEQVERIKESKGAKGAKKDKEMATQMLVGQKGVTVLGKGGEKVEAVNGKKRKRSEGGDDDAGGPSGVRLKL